jgi:hypothetical protein
LQIAKCIFYSINRSLGLLEKVGLMLVHLWRMRGI